MDYTLNMKEVTYALSEALDFVGVDDNMHGKRVAYMAAAIAKEIGYSKDEIDDILYAGMLHDCGVSSTDVHSHLITELDWDNSQVHCIRGEELLQKTKMYSQYAPYIRNHHTHWNDFASEVDTKVKTISNIIYLVDRVDALRAQMKGTGPRTTNSIQKTIQKYSNDMFSPELVEAFIKVSASGSFWFYLEEEALDEYFIEWVETGIDINISFEDLKEIALMFAAVVDAKSTYTSEHSIGVGTLSRYLADLFELPTENCEKIEIAGLLHDLGKLRVEDAILNKPGALNADERLKMDRHGFDSDIILRRIKGFKDIANLASLHHETLDAQGYPYSLGAELIPFEARIIAVADIFQALIQKRPYREGLNASEAYEIIFQMYENGKLDVEVVQKLKENLQECYENANIDY